MKRLSAILWLLLAALPASAQTLTLKVGVLRQTHSRETLSLLDIPATDDGLAGALLGAIDNNTTGKFIQQSYEVIDSKLDQDTTIEKEINALIDQGVIHHC